MKKIGDTVQNGKSELTATLKTNLYNVITLLIVVALIIAGLDIFKGKEVTWQSIAAEIPAWLPYFFAAEALDTNLYSKGKCDGKMSVKFTGIVELYSTIVENLKGEDFAKLHEFCAKQNAEALVEGRTRILKRVSIPYEWYTDAFTYNGIQYIALSKQKYKNIKQVFNKEVAIAVFKANHYKIKGLQVNSLLGNTTYSDSTNLGANEVQLTKSHTILHTIFYLLITAVFMFIGIKDIKDWGWAGILIVVFKAMYALVKSIASYFKGYDDITLHLSNHIARKTDVLKQFKSEYAIE